MDIALTAADVSPTVYGISLALAITAFTVAGVALARLKRSQIAGMGCGAIFGFVTYLVGMNTPRVFETSPILGTLLLLVAFGVVVGYFIGAVVNTMRQERD